MTDRPPGWRPKTRGDCLEGLRPCPYVGCRHHLWVEVDHDGAIDFKGGSTFRALLSMRDTCSLDVADRGPMEVTDIARIYGTYRQAINSAEDRAFRALRAGINRDDRTLVAPPARLCLDCKASIVHRRRNALRCFPCAAASVARRDKQRAQDRANGRSPPPSRCASCHRTFEQPRGRRKQICPDCRTVGVQRRWTPRLRRQG